MFLWHLRVENYVYSQTEPELPTKYVKLAGGVSLNCTKTQSSPDKPLAFAQNHLYGMQNIYIQRKMNVFLWPHSSSVLLSSLLISVWLLMNAPLGSRTALLSDEHGLSVSLGSDYYGFFFCTGIIRKDFSDTFGWDDIRLSAVLGSD